MPGQILRRLRAQYDGGRQRLSRREMLAQTLLGAAGLLLSSHTLRARRTSSGRVAVVGGGFAGLAAAHELASVGFEVQLFEARNRLGGRVLSFHDLAGGATVEGGGELIGSNHPAWIAYQQRFKLRFLDVPEDANDTPVVLDGHRLSRSEGARLWEEMETAYRALNVLATPVDAAEPWRSPDALRLDSETVAAWIAQAPISPHCRSALDAEFAADNGIGTVWQSQLANLAQIKGGGLERYWTDSEVFRCDGGNQQLARALAHALPHESVHLATPVARVQVGLDRVRLTLRDGSIVEADHVVLAVPPSVWNRIVFDPALPFTRRPQMGRNVKYLATMRSRFWHRDHRAPDWLSDGPVQLTWEATGGQTHGGVVLTCFSGADGAVECRSWSAAERANRYLRLLESAYGEVAREFVSGRFMDWPGDPWTQASYAFPAPGEVTTIGPQWAQGAGRLHFAGEQSCYAFIGYMEGALQSGIAAAKRVAASAAVAASPRVSAAGTAGG